MKNKVLKNVVLLTCVLGLVLFSVNPVFAESYTYYNQTDFITAISPYVSYSGNSYTNQAFLSSLPSPFDTLYSNCKTHYSIDDSDISFCLLFHPNNNANIYKIILYTPTSNQTKAYFSSDNNTTVLFTYYDPATTVIQYSCQLSSGVYSYETTSYSNQVIFSNGSVGTIRFSGFYPVNIKFGNTNNIPDLFILDTVNEPPQPEPSGFTYITMNKPPTAYTALAQAFYSAAAAKLHTEFPTEYQNIPADQILVDDHNLAALFQAITANTGVFESYAVHSYDFYDNVSYNLAEGMNSIQGAMSSMQDIADRLALAFPDDQAELNDSIAETLLDDTNNTGLTTEKVSNAKSDFDEGVSMYQIDTSQSQYSTPFSAIRSGDWSFWSSTTLNNLGSGYQYTYTPQTRSSKKASNDDDDIYESNQKSLFDLLGW